MVGVRGSRPEHDALRRDLDACEKVHCRAVILFDRDVPTKGERNVQSPAQLHDLIAHIRERLGQDAIVAIDQEGGPVQRLRAARGFVESPSAADYATLPPDARAQAARALAPQLASLGVDLNFAPCVDVALNASSSIISGKGRSFGSDPRLVTSLAREVIEAHHAARVAPCIKHFPGHGSAPADSHLDLPDITACWDERAELAPFGALAPLHRDGAPLAVMTAHLLHRGVDAHAPASLSRAWTTGVLRERLGFRGVVITDSLDMRAVAERFPAGEAAARALLAGADLALDANNMPGPARPCPAPEMAKAISLAVERGELPAERVEDSARRIDRLAAFSRRGASAPAPPTPPPPA